MPDITRIAPSPTGFFHLGTARTAYFNYLAARSTGGKFILRIDDTDLIRNDEIFVNVIIDSMNWLGLDYDLFVRQSDRFELYRQKAQDLLKAGLAKVQDGAIILNFPPNVGLVWQDDLAGKMVPPADQFTDIVLIRSNGVASYNFSTCVDDIDLGVNHIIRGVDHITNTFKQQAILYCLNACGDSSHHFKYSHVGLIFQKKKKLSKRDGASNLLSWKSYKPAALLNVLLKCGWNVSDPNIDQKMPLIDKDTAISLFQSGKMRSASSTFDVQKLDFFNKKYK